MTLRLGTDGGPAVGWHGKLPTVGDFATRRLDPNFVATWDDWLSLGLEAARELTPDQWPAAYLESPTWNFLLTPGFLPAPLDTETWIGVLMPSVDKVGRYYPLTLASPIKKIPKNETEQSALWSWLLLLTDAAIDALHDDWTIEALETELTRIGLPPSVESSNDPLEQSETPPQLLMAHSPPGSMKAFFSAYSRQLDSPPNNARCIWYSEAQFDSPVLLCCDQRDRSIAKLWQGTLTTPPLGV
jgi:type VI secretion system protein ImpM